MSESKATFRAAVTLIRQLRFVDTKLSTEELSHHRRKRLEREREAYAFALAMIQEKYPVEHADALEYDDKARASA